MSDDNAPSRPAGLPQPARTAARPDTEPLKRRSVLQGAVGLSVALAIPCIVEANKPANKMRPQAGDILAHRFGEMKGQPLLPKQVPTGAELSQAAALDPESGILRDGSRLNGINVVRVEPAFIDEQTTAFALPDGIVAYSSVCTHQGCDLTQWLPDSRTFKCYCHYSEFNAGEFGKPIHGPAKRRLAILPLKLEDERIIITSPFVGKVGFKRKQF